MGPNFTRGLNIRIHGNNQNNKIIGQGKNRFFKIFKRNTKLIPETCRRSTCFTVDIVAVLKALEVICDNPPKKFVV